MISQHNLKFLATSLLEHCPGRSLQWVKKASPSSVLTGWPTLSYYGSQIADSQSFRSWATNQKLTVFRSYGHFTSSPMPLDPLLPAIDVFINFFVLLKLNYNRIRLLNVLVITGTATCLTRKSCLKILFCYYFRSRYFGVKKIPKWKLLQNKFQLDECQFICLSVNKVSTLPVTRQNTYFIVLHSIELKLWLNTLLVGGGNAPIVEGTYCNL